MRYALIVALVLCGALSCKKRERTETETQNQNRPPAETQPGAATQPPAETPSSAARTTTAPTRGEHRMEASRPESDMNRPIMQDISRVKWVDGPPGLPKGAKMRVLEGIPPFNTAKTFTVLLKFPKNYTIEPHTHLVTERVTVLDGVLSIGHGDKVERTDATPVSRGGLILIPQGHVHYAFTGNQEAVVALTGVGPWEIIYVDPKNDPRPTPARMPAQPVKSDWDAPVDYKVVQANEVQFGAPPPELGMPPGVRMAVLEGDPAEAKTFVARLQLPPGMQLPAHTSTHSMRFMVLSGSLRFAAGNGPVSEMRAPSVMLVPAGMSHAAQGDVANTVMQIVGVGPFDVTWINPTPHQPRR